MRVGPLTQRVEGALPPKTTFLVVARSRPSPNSRGADGQKFTKCVAEVVSHWPGRPPAGNGSGAGRSRGKPRHRAPANSDGSGPYRTRSWSDVWPADHHYEAWVELLADPVRAKRAYRHLLISGGGALPAARAGL